MGGLKKKTNIVSSNAMHISHDDGQPTCGRRVVVKRDDKAGILPIGEWQLAARPAPCKRKKRPQAEHHARHYRYGYAAPEICRMAAPITPGGLLQGNAPSCEKQRTSWA